MLWALPLVVCCGLVVSATAGEASVKFAKPVRLEADHKIIRVERPGYAAPTWVDMDGDGLMDLIVGQFTGAKIQIFKNLGKNVFKAGEYLKVNGMIAKDYGL
jgi:hypothetical protein